MPELTTTAIVQSYLDNTSADATLLTMMIGAAEAEIARLCGRWEIAGNFWLTAAHTERFDGEDAKNVLLRFTPVTAISSVNITTGASSSVSVTLTNLECDGIAIASLSATVAGLVGRLGWRTGGTAITSDWFGQGYPENTVLPMRDQPNWGSGESSVVVAYTGGYATVAPIYDLQFAATVIVAAMYRNRSRDPSLQSEHFGDYSYVRDILNSNEKGISSATAAIRNHMRVTA